MKSRTIESFRSEMQQSILNFYRARGLAGRELHSFSKSLQKITDELRSAGVAKDPIKKRLLEEQAPLLQFPAPFSTKPVEDNTFIILKQSGFTQKEASLSPESRVKFVEELLVQFYQAMIGGTIASEGHYAGLGTRL